MQEKPPKPITKNKEIVKILVSGFFPNYYQIENMLNEFPFRTDESRPGINIIGAKIETISLTNDLTLVYTFLSEQNRFLQQSSLYILGSDIVIIFFDLNDIQHAKRSEEINLSRIKTFEEKNIKKILLVGIHDEGKLNSPAFDFFENFQKKLLIEDSIICEYSPKGKKQLRDYMLPMIIQFGAIEQKESDQSDFLAVSPPKK